MRKNLSNDKMWWNWSIDENVLEKCWNVLKSHLLIVLNDKGWSNPEIEQILSIVRVTLIHFIFLLHFYRFLSSYFSPSYLLLGHRPVDENKINLKWEATFVHHLNNCHPILFIFKYLWWWLMKSHFIRNKTVGKTKVKIHR